MRRARGFTLVELMVVVAITSVLGTMAVISWRKSRSKTDIDNWATQFRNLVMQTSKRATATQLPFMIQVSGTRLQYCQLDTADFTTTPPYSTTRLTCPSNSENGVILRAPDDAQISLFAATADVVTATGTAPVVNRLPMPASKALYFGRNGTASTVFNEVMSPGVVATGFTAYINRQGTDELEKHRRVVVYGMSSRARIIDNY